MGPSVYDLGPSDSVWTSLVASNCDLGPSNYDSGCTVYKLVTTRYFGDSGDETSFLLDRFGRVSAL